MNEPLAIKLRPNSIKYIIGQKHLVSKDSPIYNMVKNKKIFSMILYGNPGIGKTSLATSIVNDLGYKYRLLNAVINNKKDIEVVIEEAKLYNGIVLILDEIHRLNKDKQDILLPHLETGLITLIGLTTSNPYHKINPAIRSRCQIFELKDLTKDDIINGLKKAKKELPDIKIDNESLKYIASLSSGDLRSAYNLIEIVYYTSSTKKITIDDIKKINNKPHLYGDKDESNHYDLLSALQKSIRGSDVNASIYYLARLISIGDFDSIYRRLSVIAYEDIGLANPSIGPKLFAAISLSERVGMPEERIILSEIVIEMALSPKSNSAYLAIDKALRDLETNNYPIPENIRIDTTTYKYPHDYKGGYVKQQYLPDEIKNKKYYESKLTSKYERSLNEIYEKIEKIKDN